MDNQSLYARSVTLYAGLRKAVQVRDGTIESKKNNSSRKVKLLTTTKCAIVGATAFLGFVTWPIYVYNDIRKLEVQCRGNDEHYESSLPPPKDVLGWIVM